MNEQKGWAGLALVIFSCLRADKQLYLAMWQSGSVAVWQCGSVSVWQCGANVGNLTVRLPTPDGQHRTLHAPKIYSSFPQISWLALPLGSGQWAGIRLCMW